jgi:alcohol dehydrogenase (cytochrome c)
MLDDRLYLATVDAHLIALDAKTGTVVWDTTVDNYKNGYYFTMAPLIAKGKVMIGTSGGELGIPWLHRCVRHARRQARWKTVHDPGPGRARSRHLARATRGRPAASPCG